MADIRIAVIDGRTDYSTVNGLRSELPGLGEWIGVSSIAETAAYDDGHRLAAVDIRLDSPASIPLIRNLNLRLRPSFRVDRTSKADRVILHDSLQVETLVRRPRNWIDHLRIHNMVRDLLVVAGWTEFPWGLQWAHRTDDPERVLSGREVGPKWAPIRSYDLRPADSQQSGRPRFLFDFGDVGVDGFRRWHSVRQKFERGLNALIPLARTPGGFIETGIAQSGMGLEALGYVLAQEDGLSDSRAGGQKHIERLRRIASTIPDRVVPDLDTWPKRSSDTYNGVKHANRDMPDLLEMANIQRENCLVFRIWAACRVGVPADVLRNRVRADHLYQPLTLDGPS